MDVVPLGPGFAAELRGVTLKDVASDDAAHAAVRAAFEEHSVLVFRSQDVTDEIQLAFSQRFGPPEVTKVGSQGTGSHFVILSTIGPDGKELIVRVIDADDQTVTIDGNHPLAGLELVFDLRILDVREASHEEASLGEARSGSPKTGSESVH